MPIRIFSFTFVQEAFKHSRLWSGIYTFDKNKAQICYVPSYAGIGCEPLKDFEKTVIEIILSIKIFE